MEEQLRRDALEYHRVPTYGRFLLRQPRASHEPARPCARLFARRRLRVSRHPGRPEGSGHSDVARQPRCRYH